MKKIIFILFLFASKVFAQTDYSDLWEDFFSYHNVKDIVQNGNKMIALSENAIFYFDKNELTTQKLSSVQGLPSDITSAIFYHESSKRTIVGYENGLMAIIDDANKVYIKSDIQNFSIVGSKKINDISAFENDIFLATSFGIIVFDIQNLNFKNTYFIGENSSEVVVNQININNDTIYALTENGIYVADINNPYLLDSSQWNHYFTMPFSCMVINQDQKYVSSGKNIYNLSDSFTLSNVAIVPENIKSLSENNDRYVVTSKNIVSVYDINFILLQRISNSSTFNNTFLPQAAYLESDTLYIATQKSGILKSNLNNITDFTEIHPDGPLLNDVHSITVKQNHIWAVFGGYDENYTPSGKKNGLSRFDGTKWINIPYTTEGINYRDLVHVHVDPNNMNKLFVSSWSDGMLIIEDDIVTTRWDQTNSGLESVIVPGHPEYISVRVSSSIHDKADNLWIPLLYNKLKKYSTEGIWSEVDLSNITPEFSHGLNDIVVDKVGNMWIGSKGNGALVVNEVGTKMDNFSENPNKGDLPHKNVRSIAVDKNNRVWIGTRSGLRYFDSSTSFFDQSSYQASVVSLEYGQDDDFGEALMGNQTINAICVDGADNKWFGTNSAGVVCTNSTGKETIFRFDKSNSPLPSNRINKITFDETTGKVFFATNAGIVAFNSKIVPYSNSLGEVYAYPNPVKKQHEFVTIDGRNGTHLPYGTNVKILDASGRLVYETNVEEGQEDFGGKVVWNKTNLAGNKVASGVYIVMLYNHETNETSATKIAIIN